MDAASVFLSTRLSSRDVVDLIVSFVDYPVSPIVLPTFKWKETRIPTTVVSLTTGRAVNRLFRTLEYECVGDVVEVPAKSQVAIHALHKTLETAHVNTTTFESVVTSMVIQSRDDGLPPRLECSTGQSVPFDLQVLSKAEDMCRFQLSYTLVKDTGFVHVFPSARQLLGTRHKTGWIMLVNRSDAATRVQWATRCVQYRIMTTEEGEEDSSELQWI